jgi:two-component sensor histidine kinase
MKTDKAVSLGVIVNELVTNASKYAYAPGDEGEVRVSLVREILGSDEVVLTVEDDGCGLEVAGALTGAPSKGTGLGAKVIRAMASSLKSAVEFDPAHKGVRAQVRFVT